MTPPPPRRAASVAIATAAPGGKKRASGQPDEWPRSPRALRYCGPARPRAARGAATFTDNQTVTTSAVPNPPATLGHGGSLWKLSHLDRELLKFLCTQSPVIHSTVLSSFIHPPFIRAVRHLLPPTLC